jgi:cytosine/creatinine deaminase
MMDFRKLPEARALTLKNISWPACLTDSAGDLEKGDLAIVDGRIAAATDGTAYGAVEVDMGGAMVLPAFVDMHTHLDKGHIWGRSPNPDGTFMGALETVRADCAARWTADDVRARMDFALRCAYAHGTRMIRTHLDSAAPQDAISWPVFVEMREKWDGLIDLQGVCLVAAEDFATEGAFRQTADMVQDCGGALGLFVYPLPDLMERLVACLAMAAARGLPVDFHVDETLDPNVNTLRMIAQAVIETGYDAPVVVGHCCSVSAMAEDEAMRTLDLVARAGLHVVSLPMCNLFLQDRHPYRTPRMRGITLVHEMKARGINVSFASDNTRDPFYAYGDLDMIEVLREATRIGHLDHTGPDWVQSVLANPARACGIAPPALTAGAPADLVVVKARNWNEFMARPQSDRIVIRAGRQIERQLPDYAELDHLMRPA